MSHSWPYTPVVLLPGFVIHLLALSELAIRNPDSEYGSSLLVCVGPDMGRQLYTRLAGARDIQTSNVYGAVPANLITAEEIN